MLKNKQPPAVSIRATMQQQHLASARNRRLAQQMENRPSVQAALNQKQVRPTSGRYSCWAGSGAPAACGHLSHQRLWPEPDCLPPWLHTQSLKQRLGRGNIQARLGRPMAPMMRGGGGRGLRGMTRGGLRGRARGGVMRGALSLRGWLHSRRPPPRLFLCESCRRSSPHQPGGPPWAALSGAAASPAVWQHAEALVLEECSPAEEQLAED